MSIAWLVLLPILEFAYIDSGSINNTHYNVPSTEITVGAEAIAFDFVYIKGGSTTVQQYIDIDRHAPYLTTYKFEAGIRYKGFELGYYHDCRHDVRSTAPSMYQSGGISKYFLRYGGKL